MKKGRRGAVAQLEKKRVRRHAPAAAKTAERDERNEIYEHESLERLDCEANKHEAPLTIYQLMNRNTMRPQVVTQPVERLAEQSPFILTSDWTPFWQQNCAAQV